MAFSPEQEVLPIHFEFDGNSEWLDTDLAFLSSYSSNDSGSFGFGCDALNVSNDERSSGSGELFNDETIKKQKKRKASALPKDHNRKKYAWKGGVQVPAIFKSDIRRLYYTMFQNVLNSCDIDMVRSFFQTFGSRPEGMVMKITCNCCSHPFIIELQGQELINCYWGTMFIVSPDRVSASRDVKVKARSDTERSEVTANVKIKMTNLYGITIQDVASAVGHATKAKEENRDTVGALHQRLIGRDESGRSLRISKGLHSDIGLSLLRKNGGADSPTADQYKQVEMELQASFILDERKRIECMQMSSYLMLATTCSFRRPVPYCQLVHAK